MVLLDVDLVISIQPNQNNVTIFEMVSVGWGLSSSSMCPVVVRCGADGFLSCGGLWMESVDSMGFIRVFVEFFFSSSLIKKGGLICYPPSGSKNHDGYVCKMFDFIPDSRIVNNLSKSDAGFFAALVMRVAFANCQAEFRYGLIDFLTESLNVWPHFGALKTLWIEFMADFSLAPWNPLCVVRDGVVMNITIVASINLYCYECLEWRVSLENYCSGRFENGIKESTASSGIRDRTNSFTEDGYKRLVEILVPGHCFCRGCLCCNDVDVVVLTKCFEDGFGVVTCWVNGLRCLTNATSMMEDFSECILSYDLLALDCNRGGGMNPAQFRFLQLDVCLCVRQCWAFGIWSESKYDSLGDYCDVQCLDISVKELQISDIMFLFDSFVSVKVLLTILLVNWIWGYINGARGKVGKGALTTCCEENYEEVLVLDLMVSQAVNFKCSETLVEEFPQFFAIFDLNLTAVNFRKLKYYAKLSILNPVAVRIFVLHLFQSERDELILSRFLFVTVQSGLGWLMKILRKFEGSNVNKRLQILQRLLKLFILNSRSTVWEIHPWFEAGNFSKGTILLLDLLSMLCGLNKFKSVKPFGSNCEGASLSDLDGYHSLIWPGQIIRKWLLIKWTDGCLWCMGVCIHAGPTLCLAYS